MGGLSHGHFALHFRVNREFSFGSVSSKAMVRRQPSSARLVAVCVVAALESIPVVREAVG
jgi:hypothetical protein